MIRFKIRELMAEKGFNEKRLITIAEISDETGLNRSTITRIANTPGYNCTTEVIDKFCYYFNCDVSDLMTHIKEKKQD